MRTFLLRHLTTYHYGEPVAVSHNVAHLHPRTDSGQVVTSFRLDIEPRPRVVHVRTDSWGNRIDAFVIEAPHVTLEIAAETTLSINPTAPPDPGHTPPWLAIANDAVPINVAEFRYDSTLIPCAPALRTFARETIAGHETVLGAALALNSAINRRFVYDPRATTVDTPVLKALDLRRGVCQDFAGVLIGCLRSLGLPARYVSGYLETKPPPGTPRLVGADASHAWVQAWCGHQAGWIDLDPTNDCIPGDHHIATAIGRDFADVSPLRGMVLGGGASDVRVAVDVLGSDDPSLPR